MRGGRIIGVGSPFGADRLGWRAIEQLGELPLPEWELLTLDRPGSDLIRHFQGVDDLVLIDAVQAGAVPGQPIPLSVDDLSSTVCRTSTHGVGVAEALQLAARLKQLPQRLRVIGIETGSDLSCLPEIDFETLFGLLEIGAR